MIMLAKNLESPICQLLSSASQLQTTSKACKELLNNTLVLHSLFAL